MAVPDLSRPIDIAKQFPAPISTTDCLAELGISCYTPLQYYQAYHLKPLYRRGITGRRRTIVIVDSFGSPTIASDIKTFDAQFGLPPLNLKIEQFGTIPPFDPSNGTMVGWAFETTLDVEYAHAIAPGAKIVLAETPVAETEGTVGFPEMMDAEQALINRGIGDVITQSFGATENTFPGFDGPDTPSLLNLRYAFKDALRHHVTVLAASGDEGVTNDVADGSALYPYPVNSWPSSDPLVTSVGGSQLYLDNNGNRLQPDSVWNDGFGAGGGGFSQVFRRPLFQIGVRNVVGHWRGTPDISMSAAVDGAAWVYLSFGGSGEWDLVGGTSEASPIFSGIIALDRPAGRSPARPDQPGALRPRRAEPAHRPAHRARGHHHRQQFVRRRDRLQRHHWLRPGQRLGHDRRLQVRARAGPDRLAPDRFRGPGGARPFPGPGAAGLPGKLRH